MSPASRSVQSAAGHQRLIVPCATVFVASFCIMVLELVAGRLIARYVGSSLYTWTAIIGIVLAGIALGNYIGGRIADRFSSRKALSVLFAASALACLTTVLLNNVVGEWTWLWGAGWPLRVFTHVSVVFFLPAVVLGCISPVVATWALDQGFATGRTVGAVYAWGAAGSIAGTFATGYFLVAAMGTVTIVWTVSLVLLAIAGFLRAFIVKSVHPLPAGQKSERQQSGPGGRALAAPCATVFLSSFCIMALELVAGRVIARYLGSSLYTWTAVIGVVLFGITTGYYIGGRIADRFLSRRVLAVLFAVGSLSAIVTILAVNLVGQWTWLWQFNWPLRTVLHVSLVFLFPSVVLGSISPVVAKWALDQGLATGRTIGDVYAWGTVGSILGTFATGYYLISALGTIPIIWAIGAVLIVTGCLYRPGLKISSALLGGFLLVLVFGIAPWPWAQRTGTLLGLREKADQRIIYSDETQYCYIAVKRYSRDPDVRTFNQDKLSHSCINMADITDLRYPYEPVYAGVTHRFSRNRQHLSTLTIGGGGYVFPRYIEEVWPGSRIDVVEIDPGVTEAAMQAFGLARDTFINTISLDGRNYVDELIEQQRTGVKTVSYDFIYGDAINDYSVPFQVTTREFNEKIKKILTDNGIYMINLIDIYESGLFLGAMVKTLTLSFPHVYVISDKNVSPSVRNTFVIICAKSPLDMTNVVDDYRKGLNQWYLSESEVQELLRRSGDLVLTDNYAPVENLLAPVVRRDVGQASSMRKEALARDLAEQMQKLAWEGKAVEAFEKLMEMNSLYPHTSVRGFTVLGNILMAQKKTEQAADVFQMGLAYHAKNRPSANVADIYYYYAGVLNSLDRAVEANTMLFLAQKGYVKQLEEHPRSVEARIHLGDIAFQQGNLDRSIDFFTQALKLDPATPGNHFALIKALERAGRLEDTIAVTRQAIRIMQQAGRNDVVQKLQNYLAKLQGLKQPSP